MQAQPMMGKAQVRLQQYRDALFEGEDATVLQILDDSGRGIDDEINPDEANTTLLHLVLRDNKVSLNLVQELLRRGADPNKRKGVGQYASPPLEIIAASPSSPQQLDVVKELLKAGADPTVQTQMCTTRGTRYETAANVAHRGVQMGDAGRQPVQNLLSDVNAINALRQYGRHAPLPPDAKLFLNFAQSNGDCPLCVVS